MKKKILTVFLLTAGLALTGCANGNSGGTETKAAPETEKPSETEVSSETAQAVTETGSEGTESETAQANTISPLASYVDLPDLSDCTVAAGFAEGDASTDDSGQLQLKLTVYDYDLYDMADISMLKDGDVFTICRQSVTVTSLERTESGAVLINGGMDEGGYTLITDGESTTYYALDNDDARIYYEVGKATVPVSENFVFTDSSDPDKEAVTYTAEEFFGADAEEISYHFTPYNTTIRMENGYAVEMNRVYTP